MSTKLMFWNLVLNPVINITGFSLLSAVEILFFVSKMFWKIYEQSHDQLEEDKVPPSKTGELDREKSW